MLPDQILREHAADNTINQQSYTTHTWPVESPGNEAFRHNLGRSLFHLANNLYLRAFRLRMTAPAHDGDWFFSVSQVTLFEGVWRKECVKIFLRGGGWKGVRLGVSATLCGRVNARAHAQSYRLQYRSNRNKEQSTLPRFLSVGIVRNVVSCCCFFPASCSPSEFDIFLRSRWSSTANIFPMRICFRPLF